jgi:hypothetical protein
VPGVAKPRQLVHPQTARNRDTDFFGGVGIWLGAVAQITFFERGSGQPDSSFFEPFDQIFASIAGFL